MNSPSNHRKPGMNWDGIATGLLLSALIWTAIIFVTWQLVK